MEDDTSITANAVTFVFIDFARYDTYYFALYDLSTPRSLLGYLRNYFRGIKRHIDYWLGPTGHQATPYL